MISPEDRAFKRPGPSRRPVVIRQDLHCAPATTGSLSEHRVDTLQVISSDAQCFEVEIADIKKPEADFLRGKSRALRRGHSVGFSGLSRAQDYTAALAAVVPPQH